MADRIPGILTCSRRPRPSRTIPARTVPCRFLLSFPHSLPLLHTRDCRRNHRPAKASWPSLSLSPRPYKTASWTSSPHPAPAWTLLSSPPRLPELAPTQLLPWPELGLSFDLPNLATIAPCVYLVGIAWMRHNCAAHHLPPLPAAPRPSPSRRAPPAHPRGSPLPPSPLSIEYGTPGCHSDRHWRAPPAGDERSAEHSPGEGQEAPLAL